MTKDKKAEKAPKGDAKRATRYAESLFLSSPAPTPKDYDKVCPVSDKDRKPLEPGGAPLNECEALQLPGSGYSLVRIYTDEKGKRVAGFKKD